ncbi:hypothetical protein BJV78DRAFT_1151372 [Lactifluus subvellereus]|nr:hypothetical protein BJV78DRAFT_1151372 [Lactifluus subvellereus]
MRVGIIYERIRCLDDFVGLCLWERLDVAQVGKKANRDPRASARLGPPHTPVNLLSFPFASPGYRENYECRNRRATRNHFSSPYNRPNAQPKKSSWSLSGFFGFLHPLRRRKSSEEPEESFREGAAGCDERRSADVSEPGASRPPEVLSQRDHELAQQQPLQRQLHPPLTPTRQPCKSTSGPARAISPFKASPTFESLRLDVPSQSPVEHIWKGFPLKMGGLEEDKLRFWEAANRRTRGKSGIDGILDHITRFCSTPRPKTIPPTELPAGLIDDGETPEGAAIREFQKETGYEAEGVLDSSAVLVSDPGMTTANMKVAVLDVPLNSDMESPDQNLQDGESIVRRTVEVKRLYQELKEYEKGYLVDARLLHLAAG